jgi:thiazole synthase
MRYARLAREAGFNEFIKLEVIGDQQTLLPDVAGLLEATKQLVKEGFKVMAYTNEDLIAALRLEDAGAAAVMPLASPIGSGLGLLNPYHVRVIKSRLKCPVVVDAGVGDKVLVVQEGSSARKIFDDPWIPVQAVIVGVLDRVDIRGRQIL